MPIYCLNCGVSLPEGVAFCDACGTPVRGQGERAAGSGSAAPAPSSVGAVQNGNALGGAGAVTCPVCGATALPGEAFCDNCGTSLLPGNNFAGAPASASPAPQPQSQSPALTNSPSPVTYTPATYAPVSAPAKAVSLVITSPAPPATIQVPDGPEIIVGRSDPQSNSYPDLDLGPYGGLDLGVSRRHFRLSHTGDQYFIEDLNSVNGVVVNGQRIASLHLHPLRSGDRIALGKMILAFELA